MSFGELPDRTYYLMGGPVAAVDELRYPGVDGWRNPDLIRPDDKAGLSQSTSISGRSPWPPWADLRWLWTR